MYLSEHLNIALELVEVRTGEHGMQLLMRNGRKPKGTHNAVGVEIQEVLDECCGPKGDALRKNAQNMKAKLRQSWGPDGVARKDFNAFLKKHEIYLS